MRGNVMDPNLSWTDHWSLHRGAMKCPTCPYNAVTVLHALVKSIICSQTGIPFMSCDNMIWTSESYGKSVTLPTHAITTAVHSCSWQAGNGIRRGQHINYPQTSLLAMVHVTIVCNWTKLRELTTTSGLSESFLHLPLNYWRKDIAACTPVVQCQCLVQSGPIHIIVVS